MLSDVVIIRRRCQRSAHASEIQAASHVDHDNRVAWLSFSMHDNLVQSTGFIMWIGHRKWIWKLQFWALALRRSESRNCGLFVVLNSQMELRYWLVPGNVKNNRINYEMKMKSEWKALVDTSVYFKPTDSNSCLPYSSSHPSHVKDSILYSQFLRPRRFCSEDSDFSLKSEEMRDFFDKRGYWVLLLFQRIIIASNKLVGSQHYKLHKKKIIIEISFTLTFHPHNRSAKFIILKKL